MIDSYHLGKGKKHQRLFHGVWVFAFLYACWIDICKHVFKCMNMWMQDYGSTWIFSEWGSGCEYVCFCESFCMIYVDLMLVHLYTCVFVCMCMSLVCLYQCIEKYRCMYIHIYIFVCIDGQECWCRWMKVKDLEDHMVEPGNCTSFTDEKKNWIGFLLCLYVRIYPYGEGAWFIRDVRLNNSLDFVARPKHCGDILCLL